MKRPFSGDIHADEARDREDAVRRAILEGVAQTRGEAPRAAAPPEELVEGRLAGDLSVPEGAGRPLRGGGSDIVLKANRRGKIALCQDGQERNLTEVWQWLFHRNCYWRLPDCDLLQKIAALFPDRNWTASDVKRARSRFNSGKLAGMEKRPPFLSVAYVVVAGDLCQVTPRGKRVKLVEGDRVRVKPTFND